MVERCSLLWKSFNVRWWTNILDEPTILMQPLCDDYSIYKWPNRYVSQSVHPDVYRQGKN